MTSVTIIDIMGIYKKIFTKQDLSSHLTKIFYSIIPFLCFVKYNTLYYALGYQHCQKFLAF